MSLKQSQDTVASVYAEAFGRTPLRQRIDDIFREAIELHRYTDMRSLKEETGDLLSSLLQLITECDWSADDILDANLTKIRRRMAQYKSLGRKKQVAILGGAFDPITKGHIEVAKLVLNSTGMFDEVWLMPAHRHLYGKNMVPSEHRVAMCKLASECDGRIKVSDYEIAHDMSGETYHLAKIMLEDPEFSGTCSFSWVIGQDNANTFQKWSNYEELERMVRFVVIPRTGVDPDWRITWYRKTPHIWLCPEKPLIGTSSTDARDELKGMDPFRRSVGDVPSVLYRSLDPLVINYILKNNLYTYDGSEVDA